jgi:hypothetical protein
MMIVGYESFLEVADEVLKGIQGLRDRVIGPPYDEMVSRVMWLLRWMEMSAVAQRVVTGW